MVSFESGLLGVSQLTSDMRTLIDIEKENDGAAMAVEMFVGDVKKSIGALATTLGGIDSLIFSGGIGEQSVVIRERICKGLEFIGIRLNDAANAENTFLISSSQSAVGVHVITADESRSIAIQTQELLTKEMSHKYE